MVVGYPLFDFQVKRERTMSKIIILVTMLMPLILFGQSKLSIGGMGAFYRPGLAEVNERFEVANSAGFDGSRCRPA